MLPLKANYFYFSGYCNFNIHLHVLFSKAGLQPCFPFAMLSTSTRKQMAWAKDNFRVYVLPNLQGK